MPIQLVTKKSEFIDRLQSVVNNLIDEQTEPGAIVTAMSHIMIETADKDPENGMVFLNAVAELIHARQRGAKINGV